MTQIEEIAEPDRLARALNRVSKGTFYAGWDGQTVAAFCARREAELSTRRSEILAGDQLVTKSGNSRWPERRFRHLSRMSAAWQNSQRAAFRGIIAHRHLKALGLSTQRESSLQSHLNLSLPL
jgi:hypothetical protein